MWEAIPESIRAAATNRLGILALVVIVLGLVAVVFFLDASLLFKFGVFIFMFIGFGLFFAFASRIENTSSSFRTRVSSDNKKLREAQSILAAAKQHYLFDRNDEARATYTEARTLYRAVGDRLGEANVLLGLGELEHKLGRNDEARANLHRGRARSTGQSETAWARPTCSGV